MRLQLTKHAETRLGDRKFTVADVEFCLTHHSTRYTDGRGNFRYRAELPDGREIKVVVDERVDPWVVITVID